MFLWKHEKDSHPPKLVAPFPGYYWERGKAPDSIIKKKYTNCVCLKFTMLTVRERGLPVLLQSSEIARFFPSSDLRVGTIRGRA